MTWIVFETLFAIGALLFMLLLILAAYCGEEKMLLQKKTVDYACMGLVVLFDLLLIILHVWFYSKNGF